MIRRHWRVWFIWLQVRLSILNPLYLLTAGLLLAVAVVGLVLVPIKQQKIQGKKLALAQVRQTLLQRPNQSAGMASVSEQNYQTFREVLGQVKQLEQPVKTTLDMAQRVGLQVVQADYKFTCEPNKLTCAYKIQLPAKGKYGSIRRLIEHTLMEMPFASLDEMLIKRDDISNDELDIRLRFSFHILASTLPARGKMGDAL